MPYLADPDVTLYCGDALETLRDLPDASVHMCCTSPPFYALRDYGVDGQIGLEETPQEWVDNLVAVFAEVRRVLRDDGTLWIEIGDSYASSGGDTHSGFNARYFGKEFRSNKQSGVKFPGGHKRHPTKPKDLLGQPWMLAFALRTNGWYLRKEIIWHKINAMPESVSDRPTKAHSTIFLLAKRPRYFYDPDAIREPHKTDGRRVTTVKAADGSIQHRDGERWPGSGANARSVWTIPTEPTPFAHFATWPQELCRRMILAGTSERGCCPTCGAPWRRTVCWSPSCDHLDEPIPCIVLDPFVGSGTTLVVARKHGRRSVGIELNADYCQIAADRLAQQSLLTELAS